MKMENGHGITPDLDIMAALDDALDLTPLETPHITTPDGKLIMVAVYKDTLRLRKAVRDYKAGNLRVEPRGFVEKWREYKRDAVRGPNYHNGTLLARR